VQVALALVATHEAEILTIHGDTSRLYNFAATMAERTFGAEKLLEAAHRMAMLPGVLEGLRAYYETGVTQDITKQKRKRDIAALAQGTHFTTAELWELDFGFSLTTHLEVGLCMVTL
jgi:hypothetical protein